MESITATENELKELMEKGFFVRSEPVKKGERLFIHEFTINDKTTKNRCIAKGKTVDGAIGICEVGEEFSVKNKKGGFVWFNKSNSISFLKNNKPFPEFEKAGWKPLLVRLDKIEEQIAFSVGKHTFDTDLKNPDNRSYTRYTHLKKGINFKPKVNQEVWLQTFRRTEE